MWDLEPQGNTLCNLGTGDFLPADNKAQSFVALRIHEESRKELEITQYNQADYSAARKKAGYLCEKEGKVNPFLLDLLVCYTMAYRSVNFDFHAKNFRVILSFILHEFVPP